jgi:hypothetical protein
VKLFECQACGQALYFENTICESCGHRLGYLPGLTTITALEPDGAGWVALAHPQARYRLCANAQHGVCNWLVADDAPEAFCIACRHNRTIPDLTLPENLPRWSKIEIAKHRLMYTLLRLCLPLATKAEDPEGLAFDFLQGPTEREPSLPTILTGHASGSITLNLAEADDSQREQQRESMGEPYRTLLGHFRHEIAHYYWDRLVRDSDCIGDFRSLFGDERQDYGEALQRHYAQGAPPDWTHNFVTSYASAHPWEDFAETWAHYLHMVDTLETAGAFGIRIRPTVGKTMDLATSIDFDPHEAPIERIVDAWLPLTFAVNSINRSMGLHDLYPFILAPAVVIKLAFVHALVHAGGQSARQHDDLRAVIAGLKRRVGTPLPSQEPHSEQE